MKYARQLNPGKLWKLGVFFVAIFISVFCTAEMPNLSDILKPLYEEQTSANTPGPGKTPTADSEPQEMERMAEAVFQSMHDDSEKNHKDTSRGAFTGLDQIADDILGHASASPEEDADHSVLDEAPEFRLVTEGILNWNEKAAQQAEGSVLDQAARAAARIIGNSNRTKSIKGPKTDFDPESEEEDWEEDEYLIEEDDENGPPLAFLPFTLRLFNTREEMIFAQNQERTMLQILWEEIPAISSFSSLLNEYFDPLMTSYISNENSGTSILFHLYHFNQVLLAQSSPTNEYSTFVASSSEGGPSGSFSSGGSGSLINMDLLKRNVLPVALLIFVFILILYISYKQFSL